MRTFRTGIGRLTGPMLTDISKATDQVRLGSSQLHRVASTYNEASKRRRWIFAEITGATVIGTNRWEYDWQEMKADTSSFTVRTGGWTSANQGKAWNLCEAVNDGSGIEGPGWNLATAPVGFTIKPIAECVVQLWMSRKADGDLLWFFSLANVLDGECPE